MFCRNCGAQIDESAKFCPYCGAAVYDGGADLSYTRSEQSAAAGQKNGFAIAGFVLALVSILGSLLLSVLGIVFSAIGMSRRKTCTRYNGLAKAGLIISILAIALWVILIIVLIAALA